MRGYDQYNFPAFDAARDMLLALGHDPVNPADLDRAVGIDEYSTVLPEGFIFDALRRDFAAILECDAVAFLPGWKESSGVRAERNVAENIGLALYDINPATDLFALQSEGYQLIGLSGYAQTGKDTVAAHLLEQGWERIAFADLLRQSLYVLNPVIRWSDFDGGGTWDVFDRLSAIVDKDGWDAAKTKYPEIRRLLQRMGTDVGRQLLGDNVWVDLAMRQLEPGHKYVFTDTRFPNEAAAIKAAGGQVWRIERPGTGPVNGHVSETALDDWDFDTTIVNEQDIAHLNQMVSMVLDFNFGTVA